MKTEYTAKGCVFLFIGNLKKNISSLINNIGNIIIHHFVLLLTIYYCSMRK